MNHIIPIIVKKIVNPLEIILICWFPAQGIENSTYYKCVEINISVETRYSDK